MELGRLTTSASLIASQGDCAAERMILSHSIIVQFEKSRDTSSKRHLVRYVKGKSG